MLADSYDMKQEEAKGDEDVHDLLQLMGGERAYQTSVIEVLFK